MQRSTLIRPSRIAGLFALALAVSVTACGGGNGDDKSTAAVPAAATTAATTSRPLLAQIPSLGESYPAGLVRFVDTEAGKPYGLAVTVADDGNVVAYLCDGKSLGRGFSGTIEDGATTATLAAVKGEGTVTLVLSGDEPRAAQVDAGDVAEQFALASTDTGGYFRKEIKDSTFGWVVGADGEIKGVQAKAGKSVSAQTLAPLSADDQALVGVQENPQAPPETAGFIKDRRCARLKANYQTATDQINNENSTEGVPGANLAMAKGKQLGCDWATRPGAGFITT